MANHSVSYIEKLEGQLKERFEKLLMHMHGREITDQEMRIFNYPTPYRSVIPSDVRVSVDDFATILKEIKASLGKR